MEVYLCSSKDGGWLMKLKPHSLWGHSWQERFVMLRGHELVYFKDASCRDKRGEIDIKQVLSQIEKYQ